MKRLTTIAFFLALAAVGPNIFPAAQAGYGNLHVFAIRLLMPSVVLFGIGVLAGRRWFPETSRTVVLAALAGAVATVPLEIVRLTGFHFDFMPGNLPRLMGVLLLDRFAQGPSVASDIAGWAYHFWNGAAFGVIYALVFGTRRKWVGAVYGLAIGVGFILSPVVTSLGVGFFGLEFSYGFPATVLAAHLAFGWSLAVLTQRLIGLHPGLWTAVVAWRHREDADASKPGPLSSNDIGLIALGLTLAERQFSGRSQQEREVREASRRLPPCEFETDRLVVRLDTVVRSDVSVISPVVERLMRLIRGVSGLAEHEFAIETALREALANAIIHGNRQDSRKGVRVCCAVQADRGVLIIVKDEGEGFDPATVPSPLVAENVYCTHGRGIFLINMLMDEVAFRRGGTEIHMRKSTHPAAQRYPDKPTAESMANEAK